MNKIKKKEYVGMKIYVLYILLSLSGLIVAAADIPCQPQQGFDLSKIFALRVGESGRCALKYSQRSGNNAMCSLAIAYTQNPALMQTQFPEEMVQAVDQKKDLNIHKLSDLAQEKRDARLADARDMIVLFLKLDAECLEFFGFFNRGDFSGSSVFSEEKDCRIYSGVICTKEDHLPDRDIAARAQAMQEHDSDKPFHCVVDIALWKQLTTQQRKARKKAAAVARQGRQQIFPDNCLLQ